MKKLFSAFMLGAMLAFNCVGAYAETASTEATAEQASSTSVAINSASYNTTTKNVTVTGTVTNPVDSQIITVMSTGIKETSSYDLEAILFIDQNESVKFDESGNFSLNFALSDSAVEGTRYLVRIGGSEIDSPAYMAFTFGSSSTDPDPDNPNPPQPTIIYGDINNDGVVNSADASLLLQYVLDPSSCEITTEGLEKAQIKLTPITNFTAAESAMILQKALNSGFLFPVETK